MCGRYASVSGRPELLEAFSAADATAGEPLEPDHNVAPTKPVPAILDRRGDAGPVRQLRVLRWGLVPSWAKDPSIGSRLINARAETLADKPAFRSALSRRRCLLPAAGYYEWQPGEPVPGRKKATKQPWFIHPADGSLLAMAGLYEVWSDRAGGGAGRRLWTAAVVTGDAVDELGHHHDRSPRLVARRDWDAWLDPTRQDPAAALPLLRTAGAGELAAYPVSTAVNDVSHNGPELLVPVRPGVAEGGAEAVGLDPTV